MNKDKNQITINSIKLATLLAEQRMELEATLNDEIDLERNDNSSFKEDRTEKYFENYYQEYLETINECKTKNK